MIIDSDLAEDCCTICYEKFKIGNDDVVTLWYNYRTVYLVSALVIVIGNVNGEV